MLTALLVVNPRSKFPIPSIYTGNSFPKCCLQSNPVFHFRGKRQPGIFTCTLREAARTSQSLRLQETRYLISQKLFSMLTILSSSFKALNLQKKPSVRKPATISSTNSRQAPQIAAVFAAKCHTVPALSTPQNKCPAMYSIPKGVMQQQQHPETE